MNSPYFDAAGVNFNPPPGYAALLQARTQGDLSAMGTIGANLGRFAGAGMGAYEAAQDPSIYGADATPASAGVRGFFQNMAAGGPNAQAGNPGSGGGFASLVKGQGGSTAGMSVKQLKAAAKTADAFRDQMATTTPSVGDEDPKVLGATDDEWETMGAQDKWNRVQGVVQAQAQQGVLQKMALVGAQIQDAKALALQRTQNAEDDRTSGEFMKNYYTGKQNAGEGLPGDASAAQIHDYAMNYAGQNTTGPVGRNLPRIQKEIRQDAALAESAANKWNLKPGDSFKNPDGSISVATGPNETKVQPPVSETKNLPKLPAGMMYVKNDAGEYEATDTRPKLHAESVPVKNELGRITHYETTYSGDPDQVESHVAKLNAQLGAPKPAAADPNAAPSPAFKARMSGAPQQLPATKDKLQTGQAYTTDKGVMIWNGAKFQPAQ